MYLCTYLSLLFYDFLYNKLPHSSRPLSLNYLNKTHVTTYHILHFFRSLYKFIRMYLVLNYIFQHHLLAVVTVHYNNIQIGISILYTS